MQTGSVETQYVLTTRWRYRINNARGTSPGHIHLSDLSRETKALVLNCTVRQHVIIHESSLLTKSPHKLLNRKLSQIWLSLMYLSTTQVKTKEASLFYQGNRKLQSDWQQSNSRFHSQSDEAAVWSGAAKGHCIEHFSTLAHSFIRGCCSRLFGAAMALWFT